MATVATFAGYYELTTFDPITGAYTVGAYTATPWLIGDDETDTDLNDGSSGDGVELPGESVASSAVGELNPRSEVYHGYVNGGGVITYSNSTRSYFLTTDQLGLTDTEGTAMLEAFTYPPCFLAGTRIATPAGERPIEHLRVGEPICLADGAHAIVRWVGRRTAALSRFNRRTESPVLIRAGALGGGLPRRDLYTSYRHGFALDGVLVIAGLLVNGSSIRQCVDWPEATVTYYQLEVDGHRLMLAEGSPTETFAEDGDNRSLFDNGAEYLALHPHSLPAEPMALGRVVVARQLPRAVRDRIAAAAALADTQRVA